MRQSGWRAGFPSLLEHAPEHARGHGQQEQGENALERGHGQGMRELGAVFGRPHAHGHDADQGRQIDEAQGQGGHVLGRQAVGQIADGAGRGNGQPDGRGRAYGHVDGHVAPGQKRHGHGAPADADQIRDQAHDAAGGEHAAGARYLPGGLGLDVEQHLDGDVVEKGDEKAFEKFGGELGRHPGTAQGADEDAGGDAFEDVPAYGATPVMGPVAGDGGENDGGQRRAERHLHDGGLGKPLGGKKPIQGRDHDNAAADTQQTRDDAGHDPEREIGQPERQRRHVRHSLLANT